MNILKADNLIILVIITCCTILVAMGKMPVDYFVSIVTTLIGYKFGLKVGIKKGKNESIRLIR